jgi:FkbM family methyltransferase
MSVKPHWLMRVRPAYLASFLKKVLRVQRKMVQTETGAFYIDPVSNFGTQAQSAQGYEPVMVRTIRTLLEPGDTFLDAGANEGFFSILASKCVGDTGRVISIEPQSRLQGILYRNIKENNCSNIQVYQRAISDSVGIAELSLTPDVNSGSSGLVRGTSYRLETELVPQMTLHGFLKTLSVTRIKLMKMDIESFEYEAVLGSKDLFQGEFIKHIALELHPDMLAKRGKSQAEILGFLEASGYKVNTGFQTLVLSK